MTSRLITAAGSLFILILESAPAPAQEISVRDDLGRTVSRVSLPARIVSLAPSITETLFALGLDSAVVGVTDYCNYPPAALTKTRVGGMSNPSLEQITALRPDLIVMSISGNTRADFDKLVSLGMRVFVSDPRSLKGVYKSILDLGTLCGRLENAHTMIDTMRSAEERLVAKARALPLQSTLLLVSLRPIIAVSKGTFIDELLNLAHARNVTSNAPTSYPLLAREEILRLQPDAILITQDIAHSINDVLAEYPEWRSLAAFKTGRVAFVDTDLISRPGPRIILGLRQILYAVHGE